MQIIDKELRGQVLEHYRGKEKELMEKQIDHMNEFIDQNILRYTHSLDFRKAVDLMLADLLSGKLLGR